MATAAQSCPARELIEELDVLQGLLPNFLDLDRRGNEVGLEVIAAHYKLFAAKTWKYFAEIEQQAGFAGRVALNTAARHSRKTFQAMAMYEERFQGFRTRTDGDAVPDRDEMEHVVQIFREYCETTDAFFRGALRQRARAAA
jgi:hypothetical protein